MSVSAQVLILFAIALIGILCRKLGYFNENSMYTTTQLVVNVTMPCMTLVNMQRPFEREVLFGFLITLALSAVLLIVLLLGSMWLFRTREYTRRVVISSLVGVSNSGFMGYPIILAVNPDWMIYAVAYNIAFIFICWTVDVSLFRRDGGIDMRRVLLNPNLISAVIGFALFCMNLSLPAVITEVLSMVGGLTTPLTMLLIGTRMLGLKLSEFKNRDYHYTALLRLVVLPLAVYALMIPAPLPAAVKGVMFLLTAMPAGSTTSMMAELYGKDADFAARGVAYTTLLSLVTIPLMCQLI